jgi:hypothetical protein
MDAVDLPACRLGARAIDRGNRDRLGSHLHTGVVRHRFGIIHVVERRVCAAKLSVI